MTLRRTWIVLLLAGSVLGAGAGYAQQDPAARQAAREREMLRRAQAAQKQAEEARAALETEKGKLADQLKEAESKASRTAGTAARERKRADELQRSLDEAARAREGLQKDKETLSARLADTEKQLREALADLARTRASLAERDAELVQSKDFGARENAARVDAEDKNARLYGLARELIDKYRSQGFWDAVKRKEPFTGLKQVEVENLLEGYRDRADEARVVPVPQR